MKQYQYVRLKYSATVFSTELKDHRQTIDEFARKGYTYAGYIPAILGGYGTIKAIDLIFEKECEDHEKNYDQRK